ncbi:transmembrane channel-like protein 2-B isoform X1 [Centruroides sculpturatus]|uniref:transmembrane channel-like protein 2-B isoform X1 n=2 Tax=Centruroides sculpturatus TaxID=218467 RepID=UPI000C6E2599|nr:transmembrane channel-like protein 2-B isoform X1 [Centruroides sculpturatus]
MEEIASTENESEERKNNDDTEPGNEGDDDPERDSNDDKRVEVKIEDDNDEEKDEDKTEEERNEDTAEEEKDEDKVKEDEEEEKDEDKVDDDDEDDDEDKEEAKDVPALSLLSCPRPSLTGADDDDDDDGDEELEAFLQRNFSERRRSRWGLRRGSSPFLPEGARRRLSSFTVSSGDETAISIDEGEVTEEEILENIRLHKELIESIRYQPWRMKKKYKSLRQAKTYVKKHEGELMQSKKSGDIFTKYTIILSRGWNKFKREVANLIVILTPWEMRIKRIESQFGSVVASYFTFLRWVFWVNFFITIFVCCFLMVPEILRGFNDETGMRKIAKDDEMENEPNLNSVWNFEGYLKYSPIFYGYYGNQEMTDEGYRLPLAYFLTSLCVYIFSFFVILRKMAENARMSKLSEKEDECTFAWKLFTGWDYMIGNAETAYNKTASLVMGFKESILEEKEKKKQDKNWKLVTFRVIANFLVLILLTSSAYAIVLVVERSEQPEAKEGNWWREHELQVVVSGISIIFPNLFEMIGIIEKYHPRVQLRWQLARILILNLLNLYTLIFSLFNRVIGMIKILNELKSNVTLTMETMDEKKAIIVNSTTFYQEPPLESRNLVLNHYEPSHYVQDQQSTDFQNCTLRIIQNCTLALLNKIQTTTWFTVNATDLYDAFNNTFPYGFDTTTYSYNATDDNSNYKSMVLNIVNLTSLGNWSYSADTNIGFQPIYIENNSNPFEMGDSFWKLPINTSHLGLDDENFTETVKNIFDEPSTSTKLSMDDVATWLLNSTMWNGTEESLMTTEGGDPDNCTVFLRICPTSSDTLSPDFNFTFINYTTLQPNVSEWIEVDGNATDLDNATLTTLETTESPHIVSTMLSPCKKCTDTKASKRDDIPSFESVRKMSDEFKEELKKNCWETMFGQELVKLTVSDLVMTIVSTLVTDFIRAVFVRYANQCWCWDLEKGFPGYGDFKIAENILHLVNNQGLIWMGMFFSPGLPAINTVKLCILVYFRCWVVLTCNIPHETVFKASRSNNFYFALLLIMLFLCTLPVGFAVVWLDPSWHCGPFSDYYRIYGVFTTYLESVFPSWLNKIMEYVTSPGVVIPLLLLLVLCIYYLLSLTGSLREANNDLKLQLRREKSNEKGAKSEEEAKKEEGQDPTKWSSAKKILPVLPNKFRSTSNIPGEDDEEDEDDDKQTDSRSRRVQYSEDEQTEEPNEIQTDSQSSENHKKSIPQTKKRTPKPLPKSVENLRREESEEKKRKSSRGASGSIGSGEVPVITISQPSESGLSNKKSQESLNSLDKKATPRHGKLIKKHSEPVTLTPSRGKKGKKRKGVSLDETVSESDLGNSTESKTDDTENSDPEGSVLNNQSGQLKRDRRKTELNRSQSSRSHSSSLDTPPLIEEEEDEENNKGTLPLAASKAKLQRQQADSDSLECSAKPVCLDIESGSSNGAKEAEQPREEEKKAKIQRLSTDSL